MDLGLIMGDTISIGYHAIDLPKEIVSLTRIIPSLRADHEACNLSLRLRQRSYNIMLIILQLVVIKKESLIISIPGGGRQ